jgi:FkbM family methyltransferase
VGSGKELDNIQQWNKMNWNQGTNGGLSMRVIMDRLFFKQPWLRQFITTILEGNRDVRVSVLGTSMCINTVKEHGYLRASRLSASSCLLRDELPVIINLALLLQRGDSFVDVGANVGVFVGTLARMKRIVGDTNFYAFEANPDTCARLRTAVEPLGVIAHPVALSDHNGQLEFVAGAVSNIFTTVDNASAYHVRDNVQSVPCRRLDEFDISGDSIVLKIDVEGQEKNVLVGAKKFFDANRIKAVYLDNYTDEAGVEGFLREYGFDFYEGRTLERVPGNTYSLLALRKNESPEADEARARNARVSYESLVT